MRKIKLLILLLASLVTGGLRAAQPPPPNIVWIWADNLAYGDLGVYRSDHVKTPVIDRLAAEGARFTQYYVAHTVCSPSRAALLTGRQPFRVGIVDVLRPDGPSGLPADEITLAEALRGQGYATQAIGKWHLGDRRKFLPTQNGFDHYFGLPYSMDMLPTVLYRDNEIVDRLDGDKVQDLTIRMTDEAIRFIESNRERPFFLYFSHTIPHPPLNLPKSVRTPGRPIYDDAIEHMDEQIGRVIDALDRLGLRENTLVIFTSDNGPMNRGGDTGGLRGRIRDSYEGGVRVPFIARWPGSIPPGQVIDTPAIAYDMFPTLLMLAGGQLPSDRVYDGQDIWPVLSGKGDFHRQKPFIWVYLDNVTAIRDGRWKLHVAHRDQTLDPPELYDIEQDPAETRNLQEEHPEVVARLRAALDEMQKQVPKVWGLRYPVRDTAKQPGGVRRE
jgi:arylsulfatase A-like enzyme